MEHPHGHATGDKARRRFRPGAGPAAQAFEARTGIKAPRIVAWEITRSCNLACAHCRAAAHSEPYPGELTLAQCKQLIDDITSITDPILILTGGEPLMRSDIWDIIDYAFEKGAHPVIGTNGTLVTEEVAAAIAAHGIPRVSVSLDFPTAEEQDAFRGKEGAFDETVAGMRNLRAAGVEVQVNATITKMNNAHVDALHDLAVSEGAAAFHPFLLVPTGRGEDLVDVELTPDEYEEVLTWAYHCQKNSPLHFKPTDAPQYYRIIRQQAAREGVRVTPETYGMEAMTRGCLGGISFVFVSHVGDVQPCGYFDMKLGNVLEQPFSEIWEKSPVFADLRDYGRLKGKCGMCEYKGVCGGCRARALAATGDYLAEEPYCAYVPRSLVRQRVLDEIQGGFPLEPDPYGVLAERLGFDKERVLDAVASLREDGTVRRIGASFSSRHLGYRASLCALAVEGDEARIDAVADLVSAHPEVTHNYLRSDRYNLWFTIIAHSEAEIRRVLADIIAETGVEDALDLPASAVYKINVDFGRGHSAKPKKEEVNPAVLPDDPVDVALVRWAQGDAEGEQPYEAAARLISEQTGVALGQEDVLALLRSWKDKGVMRRFGAMVKHRQMGYLFNGMTIWDVPPERLDETALTLAGMPYVSHCYARTRSEKWPYNLYAMAHAKTQEELDVQVDELSRLAGLVPKVLVSAKEYKKAPPVYFAER